VRNRTAGVLANDGDLELLPPEGGVLLAESGWESESGVGVASIDDGDEDLTATAGWHLVRRVLWYLSDHVTKVNARSFH